MPDFDVDQIQLFTERAVSDWFMNSGIQMGRHEFHRSFAFYSIGVPRLHELSKHVIYHVGRETGHPGLDLPIDWTQQYLQATIGDYVHGAAARLMTALPGGSSTIPTGPIRK